MVFKEKALTSFLRLLLLFAVVLNGESAIASSWQDQLQTVIDQSAYRGLSVTPVAIFGDGNLSNGIEDDRQRSDLGNPMEIRAIAPVGVIICDGRISGSGTMLDVSAITPQPESTPILATAAHVFFEERSGTPFKVCIFRASTEDVQSALVDLETRVSGYTGTSNRFQNSVGEDWAFARLKTSIPKMQGIRPVIGDLSESADPGYSYILSAYDRWTDSVVLSRHCRIFVPDAENLTNGSKKELLHDCDAIGGASGGAMLAAVNNTVSPILVGIHLGQIWSKKQYPLSAFPNGPEDWGQKPDPKIHTNYFRVFDQELMDALIRFANLKIP